MSVVGSILGLQNPIYKRLGGTNGVWAKNERRLRGGTDIVDELFPWEFETDGEGHHKSRQDRAVYTNFPARMTEKFVGHLSREAPKIGEAVDFGPLGQVSVTRSAELTRADMLYQSADGTGNDGTDWVSFFDGVQKRAMATGHRWLVIEVPMKKTGGSAYMSDEEAGLRPYIIEYSPTQVPDWHYQDGKLQYLIVKYSVRTPVLKKGSIDSVAQSRTMVYVRRGFEGFGEYYSTGGHWLYDENENLLSFGSNARTNGEIPAVPFFYEKDDEDFSRPALTQIGQIAVAHMNLDSAGDNDAIEGGMRRIYALGLRSEEHDVVKDQIDQGSRFVAVPSSAIDGRNPQIIDSAQATANDAIESRMKKKEQQAAFLAMDELRSGANTSGISRQIEWSDLKSPRLALMARNRAVAENMCLRYAIMRWGFTDTETAFIDWKFDFDIVPVIDDVKDLVDITMNMGVKSGTLFSSLIEIALGEKGFSKSISGDIDTIKAEIKQSTELNDDGDNDDEEFVNA